jgi:hypothetical protein
MKRDEWNSILGGSDEPNAIFVGEVETAPAPERDATALFASDNAIAVELNLVDPARANRRLLNERWLSREDEAGWRRAPLCGGTVTREHSPEIIMLVDDRQRPGKIRLRRARDQADLAICSVRRDPFVRLASRFDGAVGVPRSVRASMAKPAACHS